MTCTLCNHDHLPDIACSMTRIQEFKRSKLVLKPPAELGDTPPFIPEIEIPLVAVEQNSKNKSEPKVVFDRGKFMREMHARKKNEAKSA